MSEYNGVTWYMFKSHGITSAVGNNATFYNFTCNIFPVLYILRLVENWKWFGLTLPFFLWVTLL